MGESRSVVDVVIPQPLSPVVAIILRAPLSFFAHTHWQVATGGAYEPTTTTDVMLDVLTRFAGQMTRHGYLALSDIRSLITLTAAWHKVEACAMFVCFVSRVPCIWVSVCVVVLTPTTLPPML